MDAKACEDAFPVNECSFEKCDHTACHHYQVILADPPWAYTAGGKTYQGETKYPTLKLSELKKIPVWDIAGKDCALLMWTTSVFIPQAVKLMEYWGFKYVTMFAVWRKVYADGTPIHGMGHYTRSCHEFLLLGKKGRIKQFRRRADLSQLLSAEHSIVAKRTTHSVKPVEAFHLIEEFFNVDRMIELFARKKYAGFDAWGLELDGYFISDAPKPKPKPKPDAAAKPVHV